jgi:biopolymer transport protein ExbB
MSLGLPLRAPRSIEEEKRMLTTMVKFFQEGGFFMWPIALVFALGLAIAIERYIYITRHTMLNRSLWNDLVPHLKSGNFKQAVQLTQASPSFIGSILNYGLARISTSRNRDDIEKAMDESLMEVVPKLERRTHYLSSFANVATLLGLLGTIIGLIQAFQAVAAANPAEKAQLLSESISVAMNTTAFGLIVAIPLLLVHSVLPRDGIGEVSERDRRTRGRGAAGLTHVARGRSSSSPWSGRGRHEHHGVHEPDGHSRAVSADHGGVLAPDDPAVESAR